MEEKNPNGFDCVCAAADNGWRVEMSNGVEEIEGGERSRSLWGCKIFTKSKNLSEIF